MERLEKALEEYKTSNLSLRELALKHHISRPTLAGFFLGRGIDIYSRKSKVNTFIFECIDTEEKAYWLGFLYADGSVSHYKASKRVELGLKESDLEHLIKFTKFLQYNGKIHYRSKTKSYRVIFGCQKVHDDLIRLGCVEKKSLILLFPSESIVSDSLIRHFVRGYFDGDGSISAYHNVRGDIRKTVSLLGTKEFLTDLLCKLSFSNTSIIKKCKNNDSNNYYFQLGKNDSKRFLDYIYSDASVYLDRKYNLYLL